MFCVTGKSLIADSMLLEGLIPDGVMLRPVKVTVFLQNWNFWLSLINDNTVTGTHIEIIPSVVECLLNGIIIK